MRDVFFLQSELNRVRSPSPAGSIRNVNPTGSNYNCVGCAIGTDYTLAGRPTSALPSNRATPISYLENLYGRSFSYPVNNISFITNRMQQAGNGSRGIVYGSRGQNTIGHVFNVVNQNGTIRFLDGQTGGQAQFAGYIYFQLLRTN
ncbi:toxin glutamine deamidase domain-containing protein [Acinetobacter sp. Root1280]|uniref:toxin glutamine deamidase domain-containing protein n=1 Tax=Acinetobacter sp. Root1280 TaxID=1736444 RepID=UPI001D0D2255